MTKKKFNPHKYLQHTQNKQEKISNDNNTDIEKVITEIESNHTDITSGYDNWRNIGFALSDEFGEQGRTYFHRISRFYPEYSHAECDKQYDSCLQSKGHGITIKTFYHLAKEAGINIVSDKPKTIKRLNKTKYEKLPVISDSVYDNLPVFLQEVTRAGTTDLEKDIILLGTITTVSACIPVIFGIYDNRKVYPNLFLFVTANASAGKGMLTHCKRLVYPIHQELREESQQLFEEYEREMNIYNAQKRKNPDMIKPEKPPERMLFIPANNSVTGTFQLLSDNNGKGLIFETEGDTLANTFKSDFGNYSDGFRKAFHHETISYFRRTDREYVEIEHPCLSAMLSGTPGQIHNLIKDAEDGLFSRFMFYYLEMELVWKNVFAKNTDSGAEEFFNNLGQQFTRFYNSIKSLPEREFKLNAEQQQLFNKTFEQWQKQYANLIGKEYIATVRRLGLITYRIAMILSIIRYMNNENIPDPVYCEERDFQSAIAITEVLNHHAEKIFSELPAPIQTVKRPNREEKFFNQLPDKFSRNDYLAVANTLEIPDKTAQGYISKLVKTNLIHREKQDQYIKILNEDTEEVKDS